MIVKHKITQVITSHLLVVVGILYSFLCVSFQVMF